MRSWAYNVKLETVGRSVSQGAVSVILGGFIILTLLLFAGCSDSDKADSEGKKAPAPSPMAAVVLEAPKGIIKADPNPVAAGLEPLGKTKITWDTGTDMGDVTIYVATDKDPEAPFSGGEKAGSTEAPWIQVGDHYDFRLYVGKGANRKLIDHVTVTRNK